MRSGPCDPTFLCRVTFGTAVRIRKCSAASPADDTAVRTGISRKRSTAIRAGAGLNRPARIHDSDVGGGNCIYTLYEKYWRFSMLWVADEHDIYPRHKAEVC